MKQSILTKRQTKQLAKVIDYFGERANLIVNVRYDDKCNNGHNTFAITGEIKVIGRRYRDGDCEACGCLHEDIEKAFPELKEAIQYHLCSSDGPMHYIANTLYHMSNKDHNGLKKGEYGSHIKKVLSSDTSHAGKVELYATDSIYTNRKKNPNLKNSNKKELAKLEEFVSALKVNYEIIEEGCKYSLSEGKERDLKSARSCAIWPNATIKQLSSKKALENRLPKVMDRFVEIVESFGFEY